MTLHTAEPEYLPAHTEPVRPHAAWRREVPASWQCDVIETETAQVVATTRRCGSPEQAQACAARIIARLAAGKPYGRESGR